MIEGIHELSGTTVKEVMLPRIDVIFISIDSQVQELLNTIVDSGHSRFPVYHETLDNVVGVLYAKDLLHSMVKGEGEPKIEKIIRPA
ncbi:MAG TPA: CBS domain-containing protein, partial [Spirochaetales bacterium]|nr:CBS domain-containing protein [Spirochaetales bacterium]